MVKARNYTKERLNETKARKEARKARGRARTALGLKDGDPRTVQHKKPLSKGGSNAKSNLSTTSYKANSRQGGKMGNRAGKARGGRK
jgi:5-methylcytosine-specific restriction endonuclease McrA